MTGGQDNRNSPRGEKNQVRIIGVDPGLANSGVGVVDEDNGALRLVEYGTISTPADTPFPERLLTIHVRFDEILDRTGPELCAVESIFFAKNAKSAFQVGHARGVFIVCAARRGIPVYEYSPPQIKKALVGAGRADKAQVQYMTKVILGLTEVPQPDHAADALGVAICHANSIKMMRLMGDDRQVYNWKTGGGKIRR